METRRYRTPTAAKETPAAKGKPGEGKRIEGGPLTDEELELMNAYWRACNYLAVGMIYLQDNPLLREAPRVGAREALGCSGTGARARRCRSSGST